MASNVRDQDESDDDPCRLVICEDEDSIHSGMIKKNIHIWYSDKFRWVYLINRRVSKRTTDHLWGRRQHSYRYINKNIINW